MASTEPWETRACFWMESLDLLRFWFYRTVIQIGLFDRISQRLCLLVGFDPMNFSVFRPFFPSVTSALKGTGRHLSETADHRIASGFHAIGYIRSDPLGTTKCCVQRSREMAGRHIVT